MLVLFVLLVASAASDESGGNECGVNETYSSSLSCSDIYCPIDDSDVAYDCEPIYPYTSGCKCQDNYVRKSVDDDTCILSSDCTPVTCTKPNEEWNSRPEPCFSDYCRDLINVDTSDVCVFSAPKYKPQCVCKEGFYRNEEGVCSTDEECQEYLSDSAFE